MDRRAGGIPAPHEIWQGAILVGIALATVIMSILSYGVLGVLFG